MKEARSGEETCVPSKMFVNISTVCPLPNIPTRCLWMLLLCSQFTHKVFVNISTVYTLTQYTIAIPVLFTQYSQPVFMNTCTVYTIYPQGVYEYLYCIHNITIKCLWIPVLNTQYIHKVFMNTCTVNITIYCISRKYQILKACY